MKVNLLLTLAAIYGGLLGLGLLIAPEFVLPGAFGASVPITVVGNLRGYGAVLIGVAVLDWFARNSEANQARDAILLGNFVGFLLLTLTGILRFSGGSLGPGLITLVIHALFAVAFLVIGRANMSTSKK